MDLLGNIPVGFPLITQTPLAHDFSLSLSPLSRHVAISSVVSNLPPPNPSKEIVFVKKKIETCEVEAASSVFFQFKQRHFLNFQTVK